MELGKSQHLQFIKQTVSTQLGHISKWRTQHSLINLRKVDFVRASHMELKYKLHLRSNAQKHVQHNTIVMQTVCQKLSL